MEIVGANLFWSIPSCALNLDAADLFPFHGYVLEQRVSGGKQKHQGMLI